MPSDQLALRDIQDHVRLAREFVAGMTEDAFVADRRTFYAVSRCLEIISEAARRLSPTVRDRNPELPWRKIMGLGNVYRHDYDNVTEELVWRTVQDSLEPLLTAIEAEIGDMDEFLEPPGASGEI